MKLCGLGVAESDRDLSVRKVDFCLLERPASNSETAWARRISGFSDDAFVRTPDMTVAKRLYHSRL